MRLAILAFTVLALTGVAYAQDDNGGGGGDNTATPTETAAPDTTASEAPASEEASSAAVACADGSAPPCAAAPVEDNPFANGVSLSPYDTPNGSPPPSGIVTKNGRAG